MQRRVRCQDQKKNEERGHVTKPRKENVFRKKRPRKMSISVNGLGNVKVVTIPREVEVILGILNSQWEVAG